LSRARASSAPSRLYENGLNRKVLFEPFQRLLELDCCVIDINKLQPDGRTREYRERISAKEERRLASFCHGAAREREMALVFDALAGGAPARACDVPVAWGRVLRVERFASRVAWLPFSQLCEASVGPPDFLALAAACDAVLVSDVPALANRLDNVTRRFITLVDVLYDHQRRLVVSSSESLESIFSNVTDRPSTRAERDISVADVGGSSGRLTTMMAPDVEWSATGLIGASLASSDDIGFAILRARSRLLEMQTENYRARAQQHAQQQRAQQQHAQQQH
jgi:predicted ATPase